MPSYYKGNLSVYSDTESGAKEVGKFHIEVKPLGKRAMKGLGWLPYITGSKPKFCYEVTNITQPLNDAFGITLSRISPRKENIIHFTGVNIKKDYEDIFEDDNMIAQSGEYSYNLDVHVSVYSSSIDIVTFKAKAQEDVTFFIIALVSPFLAGVLGSLLIWLFMRCY